HYTDDVLKMPPRGKIAGPDIAVIDQWIKEGAVAAGPATVSASSKTAKDEMESTVRAPSLSAVASKMDTIPQSTADQEKFFETKIRPLLAKHCYTCHTSPPSAGLRLDSREAILKGGKDGPVIIPGHP